MISAADIYYAAKKGKLELERKLEDSGANINLVKDQDGWTALHWATFNGDLQATKLLIEVIYFYFALGKRFRA